MGEIKSTLDIIMEKTKGLTMTEEEKKALKEKEVEGKVRGLVQKLSDGILSPEDLKMELIALEKKQSSDLVKKALKEDVLNRIEPGQDNGPLLNLLETILKVDTGPIRVKFMDFNRNIENEEGTREKLLKKQIRDKGISGSAVIPNLKADPEWNKYVAEKKAGVRQQIEAML